MGLVVLRGVINGELASSVLSEAIVALVVFLGIGAIAGAIADYLVRDAVETLYRKRVAWYREGIEKMISSDPKAASTSSAGASSERTTAPTNIVR